MNQKQNGAKKEETLNLLLLEMFYHQIILILFLFGL